MLASGCCSEFNYIVKVQYGTFKWWSLLTGGRYLEVAVTSGLTISVNCTSFKRGLGEGWGQKYQT